MKSLKRGNKTKNIFWGLFLVLAAVFLIVSRLGFLENIGVFSILFAIFWVAILIEGIIKCSFGRMLFSLAFLCIIFDKQLGITTITPWTVLAAALLGTIGLNILFKRKKSYHRDAWVKHYDDRIIDVEMNSETGAEEERRETSGHQTDTLNGSNIFFSTSFGSAVKYVNSDHFEYAALECDFGAMKVYFDNVRIPSGNAIIKLDVSFGGVELYFPRHWNIINQTDNSFGEVNERNHSTTTGSPTVTIIGDVDFSGVTIIYV